MNTSPLADDFFLLCHHDYTGAPLVDGAAMGIGLAACLLGEVAWSGCVIIEREQGLVMPVRNGPPPPDAATHAVLDDINGEPKLHDVPTWLQYLARTSHERVVTRLIAGNVLLARDVRRMLRRHIHYEPTDPSRTAMARARLTTGLAYQRPVSAQDVYLLGVADAAGLLPAIVDYGGHDAHAYYEELVERAHADVRAMIQHTRTLIGTKVMGRR
jgi:hypothetical protein